MIGIFDSGIGGLTVLRELQRQIPGGDFLYFGDTAGGPYENKSRELVAARTANGLSCLADAGAGLLVVADHGTAACLTADIRHRFSIPLFDILKDGVVPGVKARDPKALGIMGPGWSKPPPPTWRPFEAHFRKPGFIQPPPPFFPPWSRPGG